MITRLDLSVHRRIHVVGVGGPGMSAIALALAEMGHEISGSDIRESPTLDRLRASGVRVHLGHEATLVDGCDGVTASPAIPSANVEVAAAHSRGRFLSRAEMMAAICAVRPTVGVAGTHGKTTTTSLLVSALHEAGLLPSFVVGGEMLDTGVNARWDSGPWTVVEVDESDGTHLQLPLAATILTNVDVDHLDHFTDFDAIVDSFRRYLSAIAGPKVVCLDDPGCRRVLDGLGNPADASIITYGAHPEAHVRFDAVEARHGRTSFEVSIAGAASRSVSTGLRGVHNVANITAVMAMTRALGITWDPVVTAVAGFAGVGRRFQIVGVESGITCVDDYAHLPREIEAVLRAARSSGDDWRRVVAVFQPNRFNRMSVLSPAYADCFTSADVVIVTDIYASGTVSIEGVTGEMVVRAVREAHPDADVRWAPRRDTLARFVAPILEAGDLCISMGCGDVETLPGEILAILRENHGRHVHEPRRFGSERHGHD
ncbi:MAG: UDP-N-acetylmuramate--L-alanine ligase [Actinomycetota bacterium]